jgi:hypothetical protein
MAAHRLRRLFERNSQRAGGGYRGQHIGCLIWRQKPRRRQYRILAVVDPEREAVRPFVRHHFGAKLRRASQAVRNNSSVAVRGHGGNQRVIGVEHCNSVGWKARHEMHFLGSQSFLGSKRLNVIGSDIRDDCNLRLEQRHHRRKCSGYACPDFLHAEPRPWRRTQQ